MQRNRCTISVSRATFLHQVLSLVSLSLLIFRLRVTRSIPSKRAAFVLFLEVLPRTSKIAGERCSIPGALTFWLHRTNACSLVCSRSLTLPGQRILAKSFRDIRGDRSIVSLNMTATPLLHATLFLFKSTSFDWSHPPVSVYNIDQKKNSTLLNP